MMRRLLIGLLLLVASNEIAHAIAARLHVPGDEHGPCTVLVLGYPANDDGSASSIERQRMTAGVAAVRRYGCDVLVVSGGAAHNTIVEADVMAGLVPALSRPAFQVLRERRAHDTRENVAFSLALVRPGDRLILVSHALHVQRARGYVCAAAPALCDRTFVHATPQSWWLFPQRLVETAHEVAVLASGG
jgi:hypothetical protein